MLWKHNYHHYKPVAYCHYQNGVENWQQIPLKRQHQN